MRRFFICLVALLALGLLAAGWYAYNKGFTRKWRTYVAREFRKHGVELWMSQLTLDPMRGIIAKNVQVFDGLNHRRTVAVIDEMRLMINWSNFVRGRAFVDALDLTDASLSLPIDPRKPRGPKFEVSGLSGKLRLPPGQIYLSRLETNFYGMRVTASGWLIHPEMFDATALAEETIDREDWIDAAGRLANRLKQLQFSGPPPEIRLRFSGDLARPQDLFAELHIRARGVRYETVKLVSLNAAATFRNGRVEVQQLSAADARGTLQFSGEYDLRERTLLAQLRSTMDPVPLVHSLAPASLQRDPDPKLDFAEPPMIELTARADFQRSPDVLLVGHVNTGAFTVRSVPFDYAMADFSTDGERWSLRDVLLAHGDGQLEGDILRASGETRSRLASTIAPEILRPLFTGKASPWFSKITFSEAAAAER